MIKDWLFLCLVEFDMMNFKLCFIVCVEKVVWKMNIRFVFKGFVFFIICVWFDDFFNLFILCFLYCREEFGRF